MRYAAVLPYSSERSGLLIQELPLYDKDLAGKRSQSHLIC